MTNPTDVRPFVATGNTLTIAATGSSAATALAAGVNRAGNPEMPMTCRIVNGGTGLAFVKFGISTDTAALTNDISVPVPAGNTEVFWVPAGSTHIISIVAAAGTATLYATPGQGV
jgi:hypothetical protein